LLEAAPLKVLLLGATGFIGRHVAARLLTDGHFVTAGVRDIASIKRRFPEINAVQLDLNRMKSPDDWLPLLAVIDAVVNCAGILQSGAGQSARDIHTTAPVALFAACERLQIGRVVQLSAISADTDAGTEYALTKKAADDDLKGRKLPWVLLRASLVYASGSYGGTSAIRGLAGFPFVTPLVGDGDQRFQPIHADDLAHAISACLTRDDLCQQTLEPCGPETLTLREIVQQTRTWLDLPTVPVLKMPERLVRIAAKVGDVAGTGPIRTTSIDQMTYGNIGDPIAFQQIIGFRPRTMAEAFQSAPSHVQDRWHSRLFFLRPALTIALVALWAGSGLAGLLNPPADEGRIMQALHLPMSWGSPIGIAFSLLDIALAVGIAMGRAGRLLAYAQIVIVFGYTVGIGFADPKLWADPYGALLKNIPVLAAMIIWSALLDER
jgi:uncharacterized protein YbjT (DUF2867 family)